MYLGVNGFSIDRFKRPTPKKAIREDTQYRNFEQTPRSARALSLSFFLSFSLSLSFSALILELFVPFNECAYVERHILNNIANGLLELIKQMWAPKRS